ncbi:MAG: response regulator [Myxococcales bacterium FL481]|nr:MAG: response regulator [Myxococcales bacterium FL481]
MPSLSTTAISETVGEALAPLLGESPSLGQTFELSGELRSQGVTAQVPFTGQLEGLVLVEASMAACSGLVGEMMGDDELPTEDVLDGLGEIANVLSGAVKNLVAQDGYSVTIGLPHIHRTEPIDAQHVVSLHSGEATTWQGVELTLCGHPLKVWLGFGAPKAKERERPHVLVVEDDGSSGKIAVRALQKAGYDVSLSVDAIEGIRQAVQERSSLVFTDIDLPAVNGAAVVGALQVVLPDSAVVVVSGLPEAEIRGLLGPAEGHVRSVLTKPLTPERWVEIAEELLGPVETDERAA